MDNPELSFCIPIMNRFNDIKATLEKNLEDNRNSIGLVEFIVLCFDADDQVEDWINRNFKEDLNTDYLRFYRSASLHSWHFGRAKNSFKSFMRGLIYASLDGDNFTGYRGGEHIIDVFKANNYNCIFHQFQGDWGDGTCGRVSLNRDDYIEIGYDESFLPRQWDELDAILSVIKKRPERKYICYRENNILNRSFPFHRFIKENDLTPEVIELDTSLDPLYERLGAQAVGKHNSTYVQDDVKLKYSSIFNHLCSFFKNTKKDDNRTVYVNELIHIQRKMVEDIEPDTLSSWFLEKQGSKGIILEEDDIVLLCCIKDEPNLLEWYLHYKDLGVDKFFIIDDHSKTKIKERLTQKDVFVWTPICGKFRYSKAFWIEILLYSYCKDKWCLTVDSDEYLSLPSFRNIKNGKKPSTSPLQRFITCGENKGVSYFCGFLLDLIPNPLVFNKIKNSKALNRSDFTNYQYRPATLNFLYKKSNTANWSYGEIYDWAYQIDVRYRINRSFDSMRKFPLFKFRPKIHINQGFHDLIVNNTKRKPEELKRRDLIPILHYKLYNIANKFVNNPESYHSETKRNIYRLISNVRGSLIAATISPYSFPYLNFKMLPISSIQTLKIRSATATNSVLNDEEIVDRSSDLFFVKCNSDIKLEDSFIYGKSFSEVIDWVVKNTPFNQILKYRDDYAVISAKLN